MFRRAYIRLTIWYVTVLMALSLAFSVWVYNQAMNELHRGFDGPIVLQLKSRLGPMVPEDLKAAIENQYSDAHWRIVLNIVILNIGVLAVGTAVSYALARRTMRPIESAVEAQDRFTADASHELRTPLAAMKTEIEVMLRDAGASKADFRGLMQSNLEEIDRMSGLAEGLLMLARSDEPVQVEPTDALQIVKEVIQRLQPLADAKHIKLTLDSQALRVMAEPKSTAVIVGTLLDNAIKYSPQGARVTIALSQKDGEGLITVSDNGPGIPEADLPHIFDRFYRADASRTKGDVTGHGLGLSIAQKLVANLDGAIHVRSHTGKGSDFTLRLPLSS